MRIYDLRDKNGRVFAFEVDNTLLRRTTVVNVAKTIPDAIVIRGPKTFSWFREDEFCEFVVDGEMFVAWEPFGDNSRYWIGPRDTSLIVNPVVRVRAAFAAWRPFLGRRRGTA